MKELVTTEVTEQYISDMRLLEVKPGGQSLFEACSNSIVLFSKYMLGFKLRAWQIDFLSRIQKAVSGDYWTREFSVNTSRQIGKSTSLAILSLWVCVFNKVPGTVHNNSIVGIISASDVQSKKLLYEINKLINIGDVFMDKYSRKGFFSELVDAKEPNNTTTVTFKPGFGDDYLLCGSKSGSVIKSYPPTSGVLGETFTVVMIDEAGKTDKISDTFFYDYIYPTGNSTDAIRVYTSTPWVLSGFFYELIDPEGQKDSHSCERLQFTVDAIKLEDEKYYDTVMRIVNQMNADGKVDEVQRAYYCRFIKGQTSYFNPEKVGALFDEGHERLESFSGECDLGVDFGGQTTSKTVLTISYLDDKGFIHRIYHKVYEVGKDDSIIDDIVVLKKYFNIQRIVPDDCPQGDYLIRDMKDKGWDVHPMNFRTDKTKKYGAFRSKLNRGQVLGYEDAGLKTEMYALEFVEGARNTIIKHAPGYSDDLIDSFLLSCYFYLNDVVGGNFYDMDDYVDSSGKWW